MKKISYLAIAISTLLLFSCERDCEKKYLKDVNPDASFEVYKNGDSTKVMDLSKDTVLVTDKITFVSTAEHNKKKGLEEKYAVYTSYKSSQYHSYVNSKDSLVSHGTAISLAASGSSYTYKNYSFTEAGKYKLYYVATINAKNGGCYERVIDSSKTITVYDPKVKDAAIYAITVKRVTQNADAYDNTELKMVPVAVTVVIEGSTITFYAKGSDFTTISDSKYYLAAIYDASSKKIKVNGTSVEVTANNNFKVSKITNGGSIEIESQDGQKTMKYTTYIKESAKSPAVVIESVAVRNSDNKDFSFSSTATVDTNAKKIYLPSLPAGASSIIISATITGIRTKVENTIAKTELPKTITFTAPNGIDKYDYKVVFNKTKPYESAAYSDFMMKYSSSTNVSFVKKSEGLYYIIPVLNTVADSSFKFVYDIKGLDALSTVSYKSNFNSGKVTASMVEHTGYVVAKDTVVWRTSMKDSIPFFIINGTDTSKVNLLVKPFKVY